MQGELLLVPEDAFACTVTPQRVASARVVYQPVPACEVEILGESEFPFSGAPIQVLTSPTATPTARLYQYTEHVSSDSNCVLAGFSFWKFPHLCFL